MTPIGRPWGRRGRFYPSFLAPRVPPGLRAPSREASWTSGWKSCRGSRTSPWETPLRTRFPRLTTTRRPWTTWTEMLLDAAGGSTGSFRPAGGRLPVGPPASTTAPLGARTLSKPGSFLPQSEGEAGRELTSCRPQTQNKPSSVTCLQSNWAGCPSNGRSCSRGRGVQAGIRTRLLDR